MIHTKKQIKTEEEIKYKNTYDMLAKDIKEGEVERNEESSINNE